MVLYNHGKREKSCSDIRKVVCYMKKVYAVIRYEDIPYYGEIPHVCKIFTNWDSAYKYMTTISKSAANYYDSYDIEEYDVEE